MPPEDTTLPANPNRVLIRMYGQGVGDCFLLTFPRAGAVEGDRPVHVLIDCGVVGGTPGGPERMRRIVRDIRETTGGRLDLLVITHEHWDHLSGFVQAEEDWRRIEVGALWTAWTERPDEGGLPAALKKILEKQRRALEQVADRALRFGLRERYETVIGLMSFLSDAAGQGVSFAAAKGVSDAFEIVKGLVPEERRAYCEPGEVRPVPGTDALAYVLGPPRSDERLRQVDPSARRETFEAEREGPAPEGAAGPAFAERDAGFSLQRMVEGRSGFNAFAMPLVAESLSLGEDRPAEGHDVGGSEAPSGLDPEAERDLYDRSFPFDRSVRVPLPVAETEAAGHPALASYFDELHHWRRIDFDWLAVAEAFALRADHLTNNTSLVLAFELPAAEGAERKVLLFAGDAQVGNWLSWDDIKAWQVVGGAKPGQARPDLNDLLKRTAFYKVGHHGSHNATLKAGGVGRMREAGELTAFVPVSPRVARDIKDWCNMPLDALLNALSERARGRVVLPNGNVWPPVEPGEVAQARARIGLEVSAARLPAVQSQGEQVEDPVPLWVQIAIDY